jgi:hypothetical protein
MIRTGASKYCLWKESAAFWRSVILTQLFVNSFSIRNGQYQEAATEEAEEEAQEEEQQDEEQQDEENNDEEENQDENNGEEENQDENNDEDGGRKLQNQAYAVVDCDVCEQSGCFEDQEEGQNNRRKLNENQNDEAEVNDENIAKWAEELLQCQDTGVQWDQDNGLYLYAGFICNSKGTGVEIAVFLDEECSIYTTNHKYSNVVSSSDSEFLSNSQEIVTYMFLNKIDCAADVGYMTTEEYQNMQAEDNDNQDEQQAEEENGDANDWCQGVFQENALSLYDCNDDGAEDEQDDEVEEDQDDTYSWYAFTLSQNDVEDNQAVCKVLQTMEGEYTVVYNDDEEAGSGSFYDYETAKSSFFGNGENGGLLAAIIIGSIVAFIAIGFIINAVCSQEKPKKERLLSHNYEGSSMS